MPDRDAIVRLLDQTLATAQIPDSSCNGLQVQGAADVRRVGLAVDACLEAYLKAVDAGCHMLVVHHGLIWTGLKSVTGRSYQHVRFLIEHDLNLYASHLPLDMHEEHGNNAEIARLLGLRDVRPFGSYHGLVIGFCGELREPATPGEIAQLLAGQLGGKPAVLPAGPSEVRTVGIVSGGAGDMIGQASQLGLDCYVTGEPVHFAYQLARELASNVVFLGHYHSEKPGVQALGRWLERAFSVETVFLDIGAFSAGEYTD
jgi:dinuclear metal center YbgI/SA1388 family protein